MMPVRSLIGGVLLSASVIAVAVVNRWAGPDYGFALFYLMTVVAAALWYGRVFAISLAVAAAIAWLVVDLSLHPVNHFLPSLWNGFTRLVIFAGTAVLVGLQRFRFDRTVELAFTDSLTGLYNRRYLDEAGARLDAAASRPGHSCALIAFDLDGLRRANDTRGHDAGDLLLVEAANLLRRSIRREDFAARLGGDEFAAVLPDTSLEQAEAIAARLREGSVALSAGVAVWEPGLSFENVLREADVRLYQAKSPTRQEPR